MLETEYPESKYQIYIGQGLSDLMIDSIKMLQCSFCADRVSFIGCMQRNKRASSYFESKQCIISEPKKMSDNLFKCYLMLDESNADYAGQHIKGTVLLEAVQQMVKSVSASFFIPSLRSEKKSFVLNYLNATFLEYVFPLDVEFTCKFEQFRYGLDGNFKAGTTIQVKQNKKIMMSVDIDFSLMDKNTLLNIESHMADSAVDEILNAPNLRLVEPLTA